jgi:hypothetical protein
MKTYTCEHCNYSTVRKANYEKHNLTDKHITALKNNIRTEDISSTKLPVTDLTTTPCKDADLNIHRYKNIPTNELDNNDITETHTGQHINQATPIIAQRKTKNSTTNHTCTKCNSTYKSYSGLWRHKKMCDPQPDTDISSQDTAKLGSPSIITQEDNIPISDTPALQSNIQLCEEVYTDTNNTYNNIGQVDAIDTYDNTDNNEPTIETYSGVKEDTPNIVPTDNQINNDNMTLFMKIADLFTELQKQVTEKKNDDSNLVAENITGVISELKNTAVEMKNAVVAIANSKPTNYNKTIKNKNTQNNIKQNNNLRFSLNMYLNEYCKNAINISEFFDNIMANINEKTYERLGRKGYVQGITEIILEELQKYKDYERPFHCVDYRRETMVIKDNDEWDKDVCAVMGNITTSVIGKGIYDISERNKQNVAAKDLREQEKYGVASCREKDLLIIRHAVGHYKTKNIEKVISNIAKNTLIDKHGYAVKIRDKKNNKQLSNTGTKQKHITTEYDYEYNDSDNGSSDSYRDSDSDSDSNSDSNSYISQNNKISMNNTDYDSDR